MELIFLYLIIINIIGFFAMVIDKEKAKRHKWRISENTFMIISILGGSLGVLLAMYTVRHKTKHLKFKIGVPLIILIQIVLVGYFIG